LCDKGTRGKELGKEGTRGKELGKEVKARRAFGQVEFGEEDEHVFGFSFWLT
jgi:hypothetical protein